MISKNRPAQEEPRPSRLSYGALNPIEIGQVYGSFPGAGES